MKKINISVSKARKEIFKMADIVQRKSVYFLSLVTINPVLL